MSLKKDNSYVGDFDQWTSDGTYQVADVFINESNYYDVCLETVQTQTDITNATVNLAADNSVESIKIGDNDPITELTGFDITYGVSDTDHNATSVPTEAGTYRAYVTPNSSNTAYTGTAKSTEFEIAASTDYTDWTSANSLPATAGEYKLMSDVTLSATWEVTADITIDLNGHGIIKNGDHVILIKNNATLTINDSGDATHYFNVTNNADAEKAIQINDTSGSKSFTGGYITGGTGRSYDALFWGEGGGIYVKQGHLIINGGTILGNSGGHGGGVCIYSGDCVMNGGTVCYNSASEGGAGIGFRTDDSTTAHFTMNGGLVTNNKNGGVATCGYSYGADYVTINGGTITNNTGNGVYGINLTISGDVTVTGNEYGVASSNNITISGAPVINDNIKRDFFLNNGKKIIIGGALSNTTQIGITTQSLGIFTSGNGADYIDSFTSDNALYEIVADKTNTELRLVCNLANTTVNVDSVHSSAIVKDGDTVIPASEYTVLYGKTAETATAEYPTELGDYYVFVAANDDSVNYIGSTCKQFTVTETFAHTYELNDSADNGWNGNKIEIYEAGSDADTLIETLTINSGSQNTGTFWLEADKIYKFKWVNGSYSDQCSFTIWDYNGEVLLNGSDSQDSEMLTYKIHDPYDVTVSGGANAAASEGNTIQTGVTSIIKKVTYTADDGYYFEDFEESVTNGITLKKIDYKTVTITGIPTENTEISVPDAVAIPTLTITGGANTTESEFAIADNFTHSATYTADDGYYFADFEEYQTNGFTVTKTNYKTVTITGIPTENTEIAVPDAVAIPTITITGGANATGSEFAIANDFTHSATFTANDGYCFEYFESIEEDGFIISWNNKSSVIISGLPTNDIEITVPDAVEKPPYKSFTYELKDTFGDGWNGAKIEIHELHGQNEPLIYTLTMSGKSLSGTFDLDLGKVYKFRWVNGNYDNECSFKIWDFNGEELLNRSGRQEAEILTYCIHDPYDVTVSGGANATVSGGNITQTGVITSIDTLIYTADDGYYFTDFEEFVTNGITVKRNSSKTVTVTGIPTENTEISVPDAVEGSGMPLEYDFEELTNGDLPDGWETSSSNSSYKWVSGMGDYSTSTGAHSGNKNLLIKHKYSGSEAILTMPSINLEGATYCNLDLWFINRNWSGDIDKFGVYYRIAEGDWNEISFTSDPHNTWTELLLSLPTAALTNNVQIGFKAVDQYGYGVAIDDVSIESDKLNENALTQEVIDANAANAVDDLITAIGTVEYTDTCNTAITDARTAYDALTDDQKALVTKLDELTQAESDYADLKADAEKLAADTAAANAVIEKINAIPASVTTADKEAIEAARAAYDALTDDQKAKVSDETVSKLEAAETALAAAFAPKISSANIILKDGFAFNFYVDNLTDATGYTVKFDGKCYEDGQKVEVKEKSGMLFATANVYAKDVNHKITAQLYNGDDPVGDPLVISVSDYLEKADDIYTTQYQQAIAASDITAAATAQKILALIKATELFSDASDAYFQSTGDISDDSVADRINAYMTALNIDDTQIKAALAPYALEDDNVKIALVLDSKTAVRVYVKDAAVDTEGTIDGNAATSFGGGANASEEYPSYFEITGITPVNIDELHTLSVGEDSYTFSVLTWCQRVMNAESAPINDKNIAKSVYAYNLAAINLITVDVASVTITNAPTEAIIAGNKGTLTATVSPDDATNKTVTWAVTEGTDVLSINSATGEYEALKAGTAKVTATAGGKTAECTITVDPETT